MINRGDIWWAEIPGPRGSEPGYRRPVLVVQANAFNRSLISTVIVVAITSNMRLADAPGNVPLRRRDGDLPRESVANISQLLTLDRRFLTERVGRLSDRRMEEVEAGMRLVLSL